MSVFGKDKTDEELPPPTFAENFELYAKWGYPNSDGTTISLIQSDKWFQRASMFNRKCNFTYTNTGLLWTNRRKEFLTFDEYIDYLIELGELTGFTLEKLKEKMIEVGRPPEDVVPDDKKKKRPRM